MYFFSIGKKILLDKRGKLLTVKKRKPPSAQRESRCLDHYENRTEST